MTSVQSLVVLDDDGARAAGRALLALHHKGLVEDRLLTDDATLDALSKEGGWRALVDVVRKGSLVDGAQALASLDAPPAADTKPLYLYFTMRDPQKVELQLRRRLARRAKPLPEAVPSYAPFDPLECFLVIDRRDAQGSALARAVSSTKAVPHDALPPHVLVPSDDGRPLAGAKGAYEVRALEDTAPYLCAALEYVGAVKAGLLRGLD